MLVSLVYGRAWGGPPPAKLGAGRCLCLVSPHPCPHAFGPLSGAHTDFGMLTLLATDDVPGLQLHLPAAGGWVDAKPLPGTFIVNLGDMLERYDQPF